MRAALIELSDSEKARAVSAFDQRFGEMERALWCLSQHARTPLLAGESAAVVEALVWTVKSWWGVMGVRAGTKIIMAKALAQAIAWSPDLFTETDWHDRRMAEDFACESVQAVVARSIALGAERREYSLASKVLHWLMPWRVPVYDSFVRQMLGVPGAWDHPRAYQAVVAAMGTLATAGGQPAMGSLEPHSPLRALDKCLWWLGGGNTGAAPVVNDPWRVVRQLGLPTDTLLQRFR